MNGRAKWEENGENGRKMGKKMGKGKEMKKKEGENARVRTSATYSSLKRFTL